MKAYTFCIALPVVFHVTVTAAYSNTDWTLLLKIINFVLNLRELELQTFFSFFIKAVLTFPILSLIYMHLSEPAGQKQYIDR